MLPLRYTRRSVDVIRPSVRFVGYYFPALRELHVHCQQQRQRSVTTASNTHVRISCSEYVKAELCATGLLRRRTALPKSFTQGRLVEVLADEDHLVYTRLAFFPVLRCLTEIDRFVHALENKLLAALAVDRKHAFAAIQIVVLLAEERALEVVKLDV